MLVTQQILKILIIVHNLIIHYTNMCKVKVIVVPVVKLQTMWLPLDWQDIHTVAANFRLSEDTLKKTHAVINRDGSERTWTQHVFYLETIMSISNATENDLIAIDANLWPGLADHIMEITKPGVLNLALTWLFRTSARTSKPNPDVCKKASEPVITEFRMMHPCEE